MAARGAPRAVIVTALALGVLATPATRYRVAEIGGKSWFVVPGGKRFVSLGVCVVDQGATPKTFDPKNPGYAAYRQYASGDEWASSALSRLRSWGFNTVGAWSDDAVLQRQAVPGIYFMPILHMGSSAGAPWRDLWDPKTVATMDAVARDGIRAHKNNPRVVGYFSDNELGWWKGAMFEWGLKAGLSSRGKLVDLLRQRYRTWPRLVADFDPDGATNFDLLRRKGKLFLRPGRGGMATVHAWMKIVSDRYYSLCRSIVKKYDPGALYLGDRYISNFYPEVAASAGKYADVVSTNLNADWNDGSFAKFYLPNLRRITGKPLMITEYYVAARENRSGNKNDSSGFPVVQTQAERARVFRRSTETLLGLPYVVGAHWFQYYDEPRNGRGDGENYDMGLVDIDDRPYEELTRTSAILNLDRVHQTPEVPRRNLGHPRLREDQAKDLARWPRDSAFVPPLRDAARGDLYLGWDPRWLYLAVYWNEDRFAEAFYRAGKVPQNERARLEVRIAGLANPIVARLGEGGTPSASGAEIIKTQNGVRNLAILRIRAPHGPLSSRSAVTLNARLDTRGRAYLMEWKGRFPLSNQDQ